MCLHCEQLTCYVWEWRVCTRWQHKYVSALRRVIMLRMAEESIHQMAISVCVCIRKRYHVTYNSGEYSPDGNIRMCLHHEQFPYYVWQWRVFTRWQHQNVSALRPVTMLLMTVESIEQMATSVCVCITNSYHVRYESGDYSPDGNTRVCVNYQQLPCYI